VKNLLLILALLLTICLPAPAQAVHFLTSRTVTLLLSAEDPNGVKSVWVRVNDGEYVEHPFADRIKLTIDEPDGLICLYIKFEDYAGNKGSTNSGCVFLDTKPPTSPFAAIEGTFVYRLRRKRRRWRRKCCRGMRGKQ